VHALPSLHVFALFACVQAHVVVENASFVQALPSSHAVAWHAPPQHVCPAAHARGVCVHVEPTQAATSQPSVATHVAAVHVGYWQSCTGSHVPPAIAVQSAFDGTCVQPIGSPHESTVHETPSSQLSVLPVHAPALHWSVTVQTSPSSQVAPSQSASAQSVVWSQSSSIPFVHASSTVGHASPITPASAGGTPVGRTQPSVASQRWPIGQSESTPTMRHVP
jgi:hypothetical protein